MLLPLLLQLMDFFFICMLFSSHIRFFSSTPSLENIAVYTNREDMGRTIKLDSDLYFVNANMRFGAECKHLIISGSFMLKCLG